MSFSCCPRSLDKNGEHECTYHLILIRARWRSWPPRGSDRWTAGGGGRYGGVNTAGDGDAQIAEPEGRGSRVADLAGVSYKTSRT